MDVLRGGTDVPNSDTPPPVPPVTLAQATLYWLKLGFMSFGGPAGQIAIMHHDLVEKKRWISESRFLHALNYCMVLLGPEAQQLATYIGWLMHRTPGGAVGPDPLRIAVFLHSRGADVDIYSTGPLPRLND